MASAILETPRLSSLKKDIYRDNYVKGKIYLRGQWRPLSTTVIPVEDVREEDGANLLFDGGLNLAKVARSLKLYAKTSLERAKS